MKILIVTQYFWPEVFRINDLALGLKERGHDVTVLTGIPNYPEGRFYKGYGIFSPRYEYYHGIKVIRVPLISRGKSQGIRLALNYFSFTFFASLMGPLLCKGDYDVTFVYEPSPVTVGLPALVMKRTRSTPVLFWVQDLWPESLSATGAVRSRWILRMVERLVRFIYQRCDRILIQSEAFKEHIEKLGIPGEKILFFPNSVEDIYRPITLDFNIPESVLLPQGFIVMFAGNIGMAQDFSTVLNAAEKLREHEDIHWVILGDGRMRSWVEDQVETRQLSRTVHLLGRYPAETMPHFFALSGVMLVILKDEPIFALTIPAKLQSYFACAAPVIAVINGEGARIVSEADAGLACPAGDDQALAEAVMQMYGLPKTVRKTMGIKGRTYFETHFGRRMLLERLEHWMINLVEE